MGCSGIGIHCLFRRCVWTCSCGTRSQFRFVAEPGDWILRVTRCTRRQDKVRVIQRPLCTSPLTIGEIALAWGFENRRAFSRLFPPAFWRDCERIAAACGVDAVGST